MICASVLQLFVTGFFCAQENCAFEIQFILFCNRFNLSSVERECFKFSQHGKKNPQTIFCAVSILTNLRLDHSKHQ
jgi:hypothetical protein